MKLAAVTDQAGVSKASPGAERCTRRQSEVQTQIWIAASPVNGRPTSRRSAQAAEARPRTAAGEASLREDVSRSLAGAGEVGLDVGREGPRPAGHLRGSVVDLGDINPHGATVGIHERQRDVAAASYAVGLGKEAHVRVEHVEDEAPFGCQVRSHGSEAAHEHRQSQADGAMSWRRRTRGRTSGRCRSHACRPAPSRPPARARPPCAEPRRACPTRAPGRCTDARRWRWGSASVRCRTRVSKTDPPCRSASAR